jgi:hypothetical protein
MTTRSGGPKRLSLNVMLLRAGGRQKMTTFDDSLITQVTTNDDRDDDIADDRAAGADRIPPSARPTDALRQAAASGAGGEAQAISAGR